MGMRLEEEEEEEDDRALLDNLSRMRCSGEETSFFMESKALLMKSVLASSVSIDSILE
jgi:hypothetical protein